jgi:hypothetical protein
MSLWDSLDSLRQVNMWLRWVPVVLGVLTVATYIATAMVSNRIEDLRAMQERQLRRELEETRQRQQPRTLDTEQRQRLLNALRGAAPKGPVEVVSVIDGEAQGYALMMHEILVEAGWPASAGVGQAIYFGPIVGMEIVVGSDPPPPYAGALQGALRAAGLEVGGRLENGRAIVELLVGHKP